MGNFKLLLHSLGATSISVTINMIYQLISVPVFLVYWGAELYGEWIILNTITAYFQMSDIGLNTATANDFSFSYANKNYKKCSILINNNILFIIFAFIFVFIALIIVEYFSILTRLFSFQLIDPTTIKIGIIILLSQVFVGTLTNTLTSIYRASNYFARGVMIDNAIRIVELSSIIIGVLISFSIVHILLLALFIKTLGLFIKYWDSRNFFMFTPSIMYFNFVELKRLAMPSISFLSFPISNSIILNGSTLLINFLLGSFAVVLFNTTRTITSLVKALLDILQKSVWPQLALAYGNKNFNLIRKIHRHIVFFSTLITIISILLLLFIGKSIYLMWTGNKIPFDPILFYSFLFILLLNCFWNASSVVIKSSNRHNLLSLIYLLTSAATLFFEYIIIKFSNSVSYVPLSFVFMELTLTFYVLRMSFIISADNMREFFSSAFQILLKPSLHIHLRK